ncbi:MAG: M1 family aminopeptidase [candidate division KSB1 bacterium]|nr:M1 family aminopeptidase [candidate division KSB1 bacterium]
MKRFFLSFIILCWTCASTLGQEGGPEKDWLKQQVHRNAQRLAQLRLCERLKTPNQEAFDVKYYLLDLQIDPLNQMISGFVTLLAQVVRNSLDQVELNFLSSMTVDSASVAGHPVNFVHASDLILISLDKTYSLGELVQVKVAYHGQPQRSGFGAFGFDEHNGKPMIWSLSEPFGARNWWPCKDVPSDKADSVDIKVTVPSNLIVASNGWLRATIDQDGTKTYWWHEGYPIATYLVSVAIYEYLTFSDYYKYSDTDSMEVQFYVFPDHYEALKNNYAKTVGMIEIFSELFGPYPFFKEKYGHAEFLWGGGMEHQTITSLGGWSEGLIAHELAHQWWGDMVTCRDFHHIWLNEGFATYAEALYYDRKYGQQAYWDEVNSNQYFGGGTIYVSNLSSVNNIFHYGRSYQKASWVLHMLRHVVGDSTFFRILKTYYADPRFQYRTAVTEEFRELCEEVSGFNLKPFFHQWIYEEYFPVYSYSWTWLEKENSYTILLQIEQTQTNTIVFHMPIDVTVQTESGDTTLVVWDSLRTQSFEFSLKSKPRALLLDKDGWILKGLDAPRQLLTSYVLHQNYPNPFHQMTTIKYELPEASQVKLAIYNLLGQEVITLVDGFQMRGYYPISWDRRDARGRMVPSGIYFYRLSTERVQKMRKMIILR